MERLQLRGQGHRHRLDHVFPIGEAKLFGARDAVDRRAKQPPQSVLRRPVVPPQTREYRRQNRASELLISWGKGLGGVGAKVVLLMDLRK